MDQFAVAQAFFLATLNQHFDLLFRFILLNLTSSGQFINNLLAFSWVIESRLIRAK